MVSNMKDAFEMEGAYSVIDLKKYPIITLKEGIVLILFAGSLLKRHWVCCFSAILKDTHGRAVTGILRKLSAYDKFIYYILLPFVM